MSNFKKPQHGLADLGPLSAYKSDPVKVDQTTEAEAMQVGRAMGFNDRGQGRVKRMGRRPQYDARVISVRGPAELLDWFAQYTNEAGHDAYWQSISDFRDMLDAQSKNSGKHKKE